MFSKIKLADGMDILPKLMVLDGEHMVCLKLRDYENVARHLYAEEAVVKLINSSRGIDTDCRKLIVDMLSFGGSENSQPAQIKPPEQTNVPADVIAGVKKALDSNQIKTDGPGVRLDDYLKVVNYENIRKARKQKGWTQKDLKEHTGLSQSQLSRLEKHPERASAEMLGKLAEALDINIIIPGSS